MDKLYPCCCRVLCWRRADKAALARGEALSLEARGWRGFARLGRAAVRGETGGSDGDAGALRCPAPESRRSPQLSKAPPVPPVLPGSAQVKGRGGGTGPRGRRKTAGAGGRQGSRGQSLPEKAAPCVGGPSAAGKAGAKRTPPPPEAQASQAEPGRGHRPALDPGTVPSGSRAISHTQGKRPRWLLDLVKFSFNQTRLIIDSRMKLE